MTKRSKVLVTGAGGFIGHHLAKYLVEIGYQVRGVDIKEPEYEPTAAQEFELLDFPTEAMGKLPAGYSRDRRGLCPGSQYGRHRIYRAEQSGDRAG